LFLLLFSWLPQDQDPTRYRIALEASFDDQGILIIKGTTDLPEGAILEIGVKRGGPGHTGQPLIRSVVRVEKGGFQVRKAIYSPPETVVPGPYRIRARFARHFQDRRAVLDSLARSGKKENGEATLTVRIGTKEEHEAALKKLREGLAHDMEEILKLHTEATQLAKQVVDGALDARSFRKECDRLRETTLAIGRRNMGRMDLRYFGIDNFADTRLGKLGRLGLGSIRSLRDAADDPAALAAALLRAEAGIRTGQRVLDDALDRMGFPVHGSPQVVEAVRAFRLRLHEVRDLVDEIENQGLDEKTACEIMHRHHDALTTLALKLAFGVHRTLYDTVVELKTAGDDCTGAINRYARSRSQVDLSQVLEALEDADRILDALDARVK
jgi:hypothetical protein